MNTRILLAGIVGGIAMFIWSSIAHMVLPLGETGVHELTNEPAIISALETNLGEGDGIYVFPGLGLGPNPTSEQKKEAMGKMAETYRTHSSGFLVFHPRGSRQLAMGKLLGIEFITEVVESLIAVWLLSRTRLAGFGSRVAFITVAGILAAIATNISYWNWYGFSTDYTLAYICTQVVSFFCAGVVAALVLKKQIFA